MDNAYLKQLALGAKFAKATFEVKGPALYHGKMYCHVYHVAENGAVQDLYFSCVEEGDDCTANHWNVYTSVKEKNLIEIHSQGTNMVESYENGVLKFPKP